MIKNYQDLIAWQKSMDFVEQIYRATSTFPKEELYGLVSQLRRCSISIPSNIAEGQGRGSDPDFARLLWIAHGSLREAETQILISGRLGFMKKPAVESLMDKAAEIGRLITGLRKTVAPQT